MEQEESNAFERELLKVPAVLDMLEDSDRQLINALFYKGISVREYAQRLGISHTMVRKRERPYFAQYEKIFFKKTEKTVSTGRYSGGISERNKYFSLTVPWQLNIKHQVQILCGELRRKAANCRAAPDKATTHIDDNDTPDQSPSER